MIGDVYKSVEEQKKYHILLKKIRCILKKYYVLIEKL